MSNIPAIVDQVRKNYYSVAPLDIKWREEQLHALIRMLNENKDELVEAIYKDLGSVKELLMINEVKGTVDEAWYVLKNLRKWVQEESRSIPFMMQPAKGSVSRKAFGLVTIISPWNYPARLLLIPLIGAIAAGNAVILKPSEVSANTSAILKKLCDKYLDPKLIATIEGGVEETTALLQQKVDYIFYTGNTQVGKIVMKAAAEHLTPVTLELGGKSPVFIDKTCNLDVTANRLLLGKCMNSGQTCVAPDYVLVEKSVKGKLIEALKAKLDHWYGGDPLKSESYSKIINPRHCARVQGYIDEVRDKVVYGGKCDPETCRIEPTLIDQPDLDSKVMKEEIFGPVLPILEYTNLDDAIRMVVERPKPLALYVFSEDKKTVDYILDKTESGGAGVNSTVFHIACPEIEFGGVGTSGMGNYNGRHTFETFSHKRGILRKATWIDPKVLYPPYTPEKRKILQSAAKEFRLPKFLIPTVVVVGGGAALFAASKL